MAFAMALGTMALPAYAAGQADPLLEADRLIADQDYNGAIIFLTEFIKENPNRFDEAQARLRVVIAKREAYNRLAQELLRVLINEPTNEEKKLSMISQLAAIDRNPNQEIKDTIAKTKTAALFVYNKAQYEKILTDGRRLIDANKYSEAALLYQSGFVLYRQEFDEGPASDITKKSVANLVDRVKAEVTDFSQSQTSLAQTVAQLESAFQAGDPEAAKVAWAATETALRDRSKRRDSVVAAGRAMETQFEAIQKQDKSATDSSFLPFAFRFTLGRATSVLPEGIVGAMDSQWIELMNRLEVAYVKEFNLLYSAAGSAFDQGRYDEAATGFERAAALSETGLASLGLWSLVTPTEVFPVMSQYGRTVVQGKPLVYERSRHLAALAASEARLARHETSAAAVLDSARASVAALGPDSALATALASLAVPRKSLVATRAAIETEGGAATPLAAEVARWTSSGLAPQGAAEAQAAYEARIAAAADRARNDEVAVASLAYGFEYGRLEAELAQRTRDVAQAWDLLDGPGSSARGGTEAQATATSAPQGSMAHYPGKSAMALAAEASLLDDYRGRIDGYLSRTGSDLLAAADPIRAWTAKAQALKAAAAGLEGQRAGLLSRAQDQKRQADAARAEAETRIQQARAALATDDFDTARDRLSKADEKYLASFSLEENPDLRGTSDAIRQKLGADIVKAENDKVVRDTRALITAGKNYYFQGIFVKAEDSLLQARARWKTTHGEDAEPEVEYWLKLAEAALSVNTGRSISATAPLYPEMSQLLSLARNYFEQGKASLDARRKDEAAAAFGQAKEKINQVKVVFPLNQEAGVLALRIDQIQDPAAFRQEFAAKYGEAKAGMKTPTNEVYAQLVDLSKIDPSYPGLKDSIYQAEIALGLRMAPPDPAKQRRANDLTAAARAIVDSGDTGRFSIALNQINEAIQLDPNNDKALAIKDRILTFQGGTAQIVLSSYAEEQYRQAVQEFQGGNLLQANAIVQRLLQDPKNAKSQKIIDLSKKIQARL